MTPWRRCQPGSGATRSEPVFPTKREGPARGRRRHAVAAEALVPPDATRVAIRIATRVATVYTNAPKRIREAILANLCTLLRPHGRSNDPREAQQCTQMSRNGAERPDPPICVHYCDPKATHNPSPRPNSVHKCPKTATRGHFGRSVYTPASPHGRSNDPREVQQCTQMPQNGAERPFPPICVHCCVAAGAVRPTSPGRRRNHLPTRTHEASVFGGKMSVKGKPRPVFAGQGCGFGRGGRI